LALIQDLARAPDLSAFLARRPGAKPSLDLLVTGARCAACLGKIERETAGLPGVATSRLNLTTGKLTVAFDSRATADPGAVLATLERLGYRASPYDPGLASEARDREGRRLVLCLAVAAFGAMNTMMFSVPLWAGLFGQELGPASRLVMQWWCALVATPCALYAGRPFFESAWRSLRARRSNMDVPISIGVLLTLGISFSETLLRGRDAYFDAAVSLVFLLLIGRWLDHQLKARARSAAADLLALQAPSAAVLDAEGHEHRRPLTDIAVGERLVVRPGDRIPVDGRVESGLAELDMSLLTGETRPVAMGAGQVCRAGAVNLSGLLVLTALAQSEHSSLAAVARLVEAGAQSKSKYVRLADRAAQIYVPVVHGAAILTFAAGWLLLGLGPREALLRAVAVLIITCPCALGLAVPAVQVAASGRLFRRGVLVKSGAALERLAQVNHVVFDKTGVLTQGRPQLTDAPASTVAIAAPLARASRHPLARALAEAAGPGPTADEVIEHPGQGVEGRIAGRTARLGRAAFVGVPSAPGPETELWFGFDGDTKIRFGFSDRLRADAVETVAALKAMGLTVEVLSGDTPDAVARCAEAVGVSQRRAGLTPADKAEAIAALQSGGHRVLMVGDGLNDAAALARADASMAPGSALDASQNAADLVFSGDSLGSVVEALRIARRARQLALENFGFAALYNMAAAPAAMLGLINPFLAALAMSGSSLVVTLNALRLRTRS
jgi:Cu2+-exporting ATPase